MGKDLGIDDALTELQCPRCQQLVTERFYGPCGRCREELAGSMWRSAREVESAGFVPKMNVVANHVATKD